MVSHSAVGRSAADASRRRAERSAAYRAEQARLAPYEDVARMIIRLRMDHDLTQEALAQRVGTSKAAISRLESGRHAPTAETLRKIAGAFGGHLVIGLEMPTSSTHTQTVLARVS
ncbi:MAG: helix-turn-helix transcriptional regulator [Actinomycetota bacterium]|jgi:DNA-binding XRE family transcriptional regulator|nr:helix-turn-helix transcriptional regulator [Actinomycetota bacterium]